MKDEVRLSRRAAYAAFGWVLTFLAWHVVWAVTGLGYPRAADHHGDVRTLMWVFEAVIVVMVIVGFALPLALARPERLRVSRWMLAGAAWTGCALLGLRGIAGAGDDVARASGSSRGLTGMTTEQVMGTAHPSAWLSFASTATDVLFVAGGLVFGLAALTYQRAFPRRGHAAQSHPPNTERTPRGLWNPGYPARQPGCGHTSSPNETDISGTGLPSSTDREPYE